MKFAVYPFLCSVFVLFYVYAIYLAWYMHNYDVGKVLSKLTTFGMQVATAGAFWCVAAILMTATTKKKKSNQSHSVVVFLSTLQDLLVLYSSVIGIVFYALVVPLTGIPTDTVEFVVHGTLPLLFFHNWWKQRRHQQDVRVLESRAAVYAYPALYWCFALVVSWQRGSLLYPLMNPLFVGGVAVALELGRRGLLKAGAVVVAE